MKRYQLTEKGFRKKFRESKPMSGESPWQFITRLSNYLERWMDMAHVEKEYDALFSMMLKEQFMNMCSSDLAIHLEEHTFGSLKEMTDQAERYLMARNTEMAKEQEKELNQGQEKIDELVRECSNCNRIGHIMADCRDKGGDNEQRCTQCGKYGHEATECRVKKETIGTTVGQRRIRHQLGGNKGRNQNSLLKENRIKYKGERNTIDGRPDGITGYNRATPEEKMQIVYTIVSGRVASTLRDTGCSTVCVNSNLVNADQLTGESKIFTFLDGKPRRAPVAKIDVDTPFLKKHQVEAICIENPQFDLV